MAQTVVSSQSGYRQPSPASPWSGASTIDVGTGSHRWMVVMVGYSGNTNPVPDTCTIGSQTLTPQTAAYTDGSVSKWRLYADLLTVEGAQTLAGTHTNNGSYGGGTRYFAFVIQGGAALTLANLLAFANPTAGSGSGNITRTVTTAEGDVAYYVGINMSNTSGAVYLGTAVSGSDTRYLACSRTRAAATTELGFAYSAGYDIRHLGFTLTEAAAAPATTVRKLLLGVG